MCFNATQTRVLVLFNMCLTLVRVVFVFIGQIDRQCGYYNDLPPASLLKSLSSVAEWSGMNDIYIKLPGILAKLEKDIFELVAQETGQNKIFFAFAKRCKCQWCPQMQRQKDRFWIVLCVSRPVCWLYNIKSSKGYSSMYLQINQTHTRSYIKIKQSFYRVFHLSNLARFQARFEPLIIFSLYLGEDVSSS